MSSNHYAVCLRTSYQDEYLIWKDGDSEPDRYLTLPRSNKFLLAKNMSGLVRLASELNIALASQPAHLVDIDSMHQTLARLRPSRTLSERSSKVLLETWNALEDMSISIGISSVAADPEIKDEAQRVYDKLFYGNNLPAVTPTGCSYQVTLTRRELAILRKAMRGAWQKICNRTAQFS